MRVTIIGLRFKLYGDTWAKRSMEMPFLSKPVSLYCDRLRFRVWPTDRELKKVQRGSASSIYDARSSVPQLTGRELSSASPSTIVMSTTFEKFYEPGVPGEKSQCP